MINCWDCKDSDNPSAQSKEYIKTKQQTLAKLKLKPIYYNCPYCGLVLKEQEYLEHLKDCEAGKGAQEYFG